jgi:hypothetical protein
MHKEALDFVARVKERFPDSFMGKRVIEVGSRNINGTVRTFFSRCKYVGYDLGYGPCVDVVVHFSDINCMNPSYYAHTIISCEAMEHDKRWVETLHMMLDSLRDGGLLIITAGGPGRPEHGTHDHDPISSPDTLDYYGNITEDAFRAAIDSHPDFVMGDFKEFEFDVRDGDFRFWGLKA